LGQHSLYSVFLLGLRGRDLLLTKKDAKAYARCQLVVVFLERSRDGVKTVEMVSGAIRALWEELETVDEEMFTT